MKTAMCPSASPARLFRAVLLSLVYLAPSAHAARISQQLLLLPEFRYLHQQPDAFGDVDEDSRVSLDLLYGIDVDSYRFFIEFIATDEKTRLARLHLGYETRGGTAFWLGRFDMNHGYWNKTFHFRNYIQPSIQPPGIAGFEKEGGLLPTHYAGADIRHRWALDGNAALQLEAGFGAGAKFNGEQLESFDFLDPEGGFKPSTSLRLSYQPDAASGTEFGGFVVDNHIPVAGMGFSTNHQTVAGGYANVILENLRLYGALYGVRNDLKASGQHQERHFFTSWLQADYQFNNQWMPYLRHEYSDGKKSDPYVALFPRFVKNRGLAGIRWDFLDNQAIKIEYAKTRYLYEDSTQWAVQWSLIFP